MSNEMNAALGISNAKQEETELNSVPYKQNLISRVPLMGGLLGFLFTNPKQALQDELDKQNKKGWSAMHIEPHSTSNLFIWILQLALLVVTFGLFTFGAGYLVLFDRNPNE